MNKLHGFCARLSLVLLVVLAILFSLSWLDIDNPDIVAFAIGVIAAPVGIGAVAWVGEWWLTNREDGV